MNLFYLVLLFVSLWDFSNAGETTEILPDVTISYTLWIGNTIAREYNISITASENTTFYRVMQLAAEEDPHFVFEAKEFDFGHYITSIDKVEEVPQLKYHWMIYKLSKSPDRLHPPSDDELSDVGVDLILIKEGENYLFWYRKVNY